MLISMMKHLYDLILDKNPNMNCHSHQLRFHYIYILANLEEEINFKFFHVRFEISF